MSPVIASLSHHLNTTTVDTLTRRLPLDRQLIPDMDARGPEADGEGEPFVQDFRLAAPSPRHAPLLAPVLYISGAR